MSRGEGGREALHLPGAAKCFGHVKEQLSMGDMGRKKYLYVNTAQLYVIGIQKDCK
jgi:hypothetical protein